MKSFLAKELCPREVFVNVGVTSFWIMVSSAPQTSETGLKKIGAKNY